MAVNTIAPLEPFIAICASSAGTPANAPAVDAIARGDDTRGDRIMAQMKDVRDGTNLQLSDDISALLNGPSIRVAAMRRIDAEPATQ